MSFLFNNTGFLGTKAPLPADISLILILLTALLLTLGWRLAVHRRYDAHRWVQTCAVVLNSVIVLVVMVGSYLNSVLPGIPDKLGEVPYWFTTVHALIGLASVILGVYVVLVGNRLLPRSLRFNNYKFFMRISYALYMIATLLGVVVYLVLYV
jgi:putative membrane protein